MLIAIRADTGFALCGEHGIVRSRRHLRHILRTRSCTKRRGNRRAGIAAGLSTLGISIPSRGTTECANSMGLIWSRFVPVVLGVPVVESALISTSNNSNGDLPDTRRRPKL